MNEEVEPSAGAGAAPGVEKKSGPSHPFYLLSVAAAHAKEGSHSSLTKIAGGSGKKKKKGEEWGEAAPSSMDYYHPRLRVHVEKRRATLAGRRQESWPHNARAYSENRLPNEALRFLWELRQERGKGGRGGTQLMTRGPSRSPSPSKRKRKKREGRGEGGRDLHGRILRRSLLNFSKAAQTKEVEKQHHCAPRSAKTKRKRKEKKKRGSGGDPNRRLSYHYVFPRLRQHQPAEKPCHRQKRGGKRRIHRPVVLLTLWTVGGDKRLHRKKRGKGKGGVASSSSRVVTGRGTGDSPLRIMLAIWPPKQREGDGK